SLLQNTELDQEQQEIVTTIRNSGNTLLTIISEILDFSKIEAGKLEIEPVSHLVRKTVEESIDLIASKAHDKGLNVVYFLDPQLPVWIIQDVTRIRQVLANLLSNAVKFTEEGHISIYVKMVNASPLTIQFSVVDTGIGIPKNRVDRLFQSFSQVDASTTRRFGGTGLGLAISKRLAELMGGEMWVESEIGTGSIFHFTIEARLDQSKDNQLLSPAISQIFNKKQALIIDQVAESHRALTAMVKSMGVMTHDVDLDILLLSQTGLSDYSVIILDVDTYLDLPSNVQRLINQVGHEAGLLFLNQLGQKLPEMQVDTRHTLNKPVKFKQLKETLNSIFTGEERRRQTGRLKTFNRDMAEENPLRILLAEDNIVNQKVALGLLSRHGYSADLAANGREVLEAFERQTYDVILMDVNMPEVDGIEASRRIRNNPLIMPQPYIIALTANAFQEDKKQLLENGLMNDYVSKPVSVERLLEALLRVPRSALKE
ncbi:MAG: ATP-binding protein, partial [Chloroflexota bacterium]